MKLMKDFDKSDASVFHNACKTLNEINKMIPKWESEFSEIKEQFVNKCKERRVQLIKEKNDIMNDLSIQEKVNTAPILYLTASEVMEKMNERMRTVEKDNKHTYDALCQLEDEPSLIDNIGEMVQMVKNEYNIWDS